MIFDVESKTVNAPDREPSPSCLTSTPGDGPSGSGEKEIIR